VLNSQDKYCIAAFTVFMEVISGIKTNVLN